jgi:uncharacterized protein (UPF0303 family)
MYKTKTQKKNALKAITQKSKKLFLSGVLSINEADKIGQMCKRAMNKL